MKQSEVNFTKNSGCRNRPKTTSQERCQHSQFETRTKISLWPMIAILEDWPFWKKGLFSRMTSCKYWKVIPQFVPLNGLHADIDICILQIRAVQAECLHIFFSMEVCIGKELKWVCNFHIHWMHNWKWYHLIELTKSFLLKYGYWTFIKGGLRTRLEGIPNLIIYATGYPYPYYTCKVPILNVTDKCIRYKLLIYICVVYHHRHFSDVYFPLK